MVLSGADPAPFVGGSGGILPREILKSRTLEMRFPAFSANSFVPIHTSESQKFCCIFGKTRKKLEPISKKQHNFSI